MTVQHLTFRNGRVHPFVLPDGRTLYISEPDGDAGLFSVYEMSRSGDSGALHGTATAWRDALAEARNLMGLLCVTSEQGGRA
jgi:hypothetical protein